jgi:tetratricopeptide (TPR) repeat protein
MRVWSVTVIAVLLAVPQGLPPMRGGGRGGQTITGQLGHPSSRSATSDALDRYVSGDYDGAIGALVYLGGFSTVDADEWIKRGGLADATRRRFIASSLALEVIAAKEAWPVALFEWACEGMRNANPPSPNEALWMRTSVALAEGDAMWSILQDPHLGHALERFPDDPHLKLARAFVAEASALQPKVTTGTVTTDQTPVALDRIAARLPDPASPADAAKKATFERIADGYRALASDPVVGAEVHLRLGDVELRLGRIDAAVAEFHEADHTNDPFVSYLAKLFLAWTKARAGETNAAIDGYRSALDITPHARSATTLLAALYLMHGRAADAESVTHDFLSANPPPADPWRMYPRGDFRSYLSLLDQLHAAMQKTPGIF